MIKAIIFDCFGVLTTDSWLAFIDSMPEGTDVESVREVHRTYTAGFISKKECADRIKELSGRSFIEAEDQVEGEVVKNSALLGYIKELKKTYKIGLLSNIATPWITDTFLTEEEQRLFDEMVFSYEVGMTKPDPRIFLLACERLGVSPREAVLVDDIERYCEAARQQGLEAIVYDNLHQLKRDLSAILNHK